MKAFSPLAFGFALAMAAGLAACCKKAPNADAPAGAAFASTYRVPT